MKGEVLNRTVEPKNAYRVLASADRQHVLHELLQRDGLASVEELSRQVAARRHMTSTEKVTDREVERARVRLVHSHLPMMIDEGVITVDWDAGEVTFTGGEAIDQLFEAAAELDEWPPDERPAVTAGDTD